MLFIYGDNSAIDALIHALAMVILLSIDEFGSKLNSIATQYNDNEIYTRDDYLFMDFEKRHALP